VKRKHKQNKTTNTNNTQILNDNSCESFINNNLATLQSIEKASIRASGYTAGFARVHVRSEIIADPQVAEDGKLAYIEVVENKRKKTATISLNYGVIILNLRLEYVKGEMRWKVDYATVNFARLLFGHNARLIETESEWHIALTIANQLLNKVIYPGQEDILIPGLNPDSQSYFTYLELANQVKDKDGVLLASMKHARLLFNNSDNRRYDDLKTSGGSQTIYLGNAVEPLLRMYRKDLEIVEKSNKDDQGKGTRRLALRKEDEECLRIEVLLRGRKLINTMMVDSEAYSDGVRLQTFALADLATPCSSVLANIKGVFKNSSYKKPAKFVEETQKLIDRIAQSVTPPPLHDLLEDLRDERDYCNASIATIRANVEAWLEHTSTTSLDQVLPGSVQSEVMHLQPLRHIGDEKYVPVGRTTALAVPVDPRIERAYSSLSTLNYRDAYYPETPTYRSA